MLRLVLASAAVGPIWTTAFAIVTGGNIAQAWPLAILAITAAILAGVTFRNWYLQARRRMNLVAAVVMPYLTGLMTLAVGGFYLLFFDPAFHADPLKLLQFWGIFGYFGSIYFVLSLPIIFPLGLATQFWMKWATRHPIW